MRRVLLRALVFSLVLTCTAVNAHAATYFQLKAGYWVGQFDRDYDSNMGTFTAKITGSDNSIQITFDGNADQGYWHFEFAAPQKQALTLGHYESATRYPFQDASVPGLNASGDGRGCNILNGSFDILDLQMSADGQTVEKFAASFTQYCEGKGPPALGVVLYNSSVTVASPLDQVAPTPTPTPTQTPTPGSDPGNDACQTISLTSSSSSFYVNSGGGVTASDTSVVGNEVLALTQDSIKVGSIKFSVRNTGTSLVASAKKGAKTLKKTFRGVKQVFVLYSASGAAGVYYVDKSLNLYLLTAAKNLGSSKLGSISADTCGG